MVLLEARSVTKRFGGVVAVDGVSFTVQRGEVFGLVGPNGAGKTTMLNLINGLLKPTSGEILFEGEVISHLPPHKVAEKGIARAFQIVRPFYGMTVRENVAMGALFSPAFRRRPVREALELADHILALVGLQDRRDAQVAELPHAMRRQLEVARALAMQPKLLLLDEVMAGLNPTEVNQMVRLIEKVNAQGITVIMVEHVMRAVMSVSHRVMVMHYGRLLFVGTPQEVRSHPEVIAAYLGRRYSQEYMERRVI